MGKHMKLTEEERATIIDALTVAACQYVKDADQAADLALHGLSMSASDHGLAYPGSAVPIYWKTLPRKAELPWSVPASQSHSLSQCCPTLALIA